MLDFVVSESRLLFLAERGPSINWKVHADDWHGDGVSDL